MCLLGLRDGLFSWVGANYSAYWGRTLEEGIKKRLGAFRPDFPVAAGQQVSLIWYVPDAGTVCTAGWEPTTLHTRGVSWVLLDLTSLWPDKLVYYSTLPDAEMVCTAGWEPNTPPILRLDPGGGNQEAARCFQT